MPINSLLQQAFNNSPEFRNQVQAEVKKQAIDLSETLDANDGNRGTLANVMKYPDQYFFPQTIVADYDWTVGFDAWATNPASADGAIQTFVAKHFNLLTGYQPAAEPTP